MPDDLAQFIRAGEAPVFIGFGSMIGLATPNVHLDAATQLMVASAKLAGCRAIIQSHWQSASPIPEEPHIYRLNTAPHMQIFPHCAAIVHHGGAGTTQTSLLCGRPSVVVAHGVDQFFWGEKLKRMGVAPALIKRRKATPADIAAAIRKVLAMPRMRSAAEKIGRQLQMENGVAEAVRIIDRRFNAMP
jgi:UDP:flavonoid glycosyltransferase YjiC (YdhE family)